MSQHTIQHLKTVLHWSGDAPIRWSKGLSVEEMNKIARGLNLHSWCGVVSRETIHHASQVFKLREPRVSSCIVNTAPKSSAGEHWICIFYNPWSENPIEYFDSVGLLAYLPEVICLFKELSPFHAIVANDTVIQNSFNHQSPACGYHALMYIIAKDNPKLVDKDRYFKGHNVDASNMFQLYNYDARFPHLNDVQAMSSIESLMQQSGIQL